MLNRPGSNPRRILFGALAVVFLGVLLAAATVRRPGNKTPNEQPAPAVYTISDNVDLVVLDVSVKDPRGGYVTGLQKSNFRVFEDGQPREISAFAAVDAPVTVGLVVDNSGSMRLKRPEVITAGLAFAKESNPKDEFFVVNFNNSVTRGLPPDLLFTDKLQTLRAALYYGTPVGQTALYDAVAYALKHLEYSHREKRTLIVVSDGGDNVSQIRFPDLQQMIEASRATIYTVGLFDPDANDLNPGVLRRMSALSGGEFFEPADLQEIVPVFNKIAKEIRNGYTLGYAPDETHDRKKLRTVKVIASEGDRNLHVRTRTKYLNIPLAQLVEQQTARNGGVDHNRQ